MKTQLSILFLLVSCSLFAQPERWQQRVTYTMQIDMNVKSHRYLGKQQVVYWNNSPDTLHHVFWHLYFNAFQPHSMMAEASLNNGYFDVAQYNRINNLGTDEMGWVRIDSLKMNGKLLNFETNETILEVPLTEPIPPHSKAVFEMQWETQVPVLIRRAGRNNAEGIDYTMGQWYPKLCEYDYQGWHSNQYLGGEFYGVWGDYDVTITIDKDYIVAAGGYLQNPLEIGYGYENADDKVERKPENGKLRWHFFAPNVHDFMWCADTQYKHVKMQASDNTTMHFFYLPYGSMQLSPLQVNNYDNNWRRLPKIMNRVRELANYNFGRYPYREYAFIQGGDFGMEYPMATTLRTNVPFDVFVEVAVHEQMHSWYQMILGNNESLHAWMDEGFTTWAEQLIMKQLNEEKLLDGGVVSLGVEYISYINSKKSNNSTEPMITHSDHYENYYNYTLNAYRKGAVMLKQLGYVVGAENFSKGMLVYYETWKFKHPNPNDFIRVMEKVSKLELDWYLQEWTQTTHTIDYSIEKVKKSDKHTGQTDLQIQRIGDMAMPLDIVVYPHSGDPQIFYVPLESMRGNKPVESNHQRTILKDHRWVDRQINLTLPLDRDEIARIIIDPSGRMADVNRKNNTWNGKARKAKPHSAGGN